MKKGRIERSCEKEIDKRRKQKTFKTLLNINTSVFLGSEQGEATVT